MTKTATYQLNQWAATDALRRSDFNADNAAIDTALATKAEKSAVTAVETALANYKTANDAAVAKKAEQSAVTAVETALANYKTSNNAAVAAKAESTALTALQNSLNSTNSNVSALSAALGSGGSNCRIATGSYTGTGTYGSGNPNTLTFPFRPLAVWVAYGSAGSDSSSPSIYSLFLCYPIPATQGTGNTYLDATWSSNGVQWMVHGTSGSAGKQFNLSGTTYYWVAIGV